MLYNKTEFIILIIFETRSFPLLSSMGILLTKNCFERHNHDYYIVFECNRSKFLVLTKLSYKLLHL